MWTRFDRYCSTGLTMGGDGWRSLKAPAMPKSHLFDDLPSLRYPLGSTAFGVW